MLHTTWHCPAIPRPVSWQCAPSTRQKPKHSAEAVDWPERFTGGVRKRLVGGHTRVHHGIQCHSIDNLQRYARHIAEYPGHSLDKISGDISIVKVFLLSAPFFRQAPEVPTRKRLRRWRCIERNVFIPYLGCGRISSQMCNLSCGQVHSREGTGCKAGLVIIQNGDYNYGASDG